MPRSTTPYSSNRERRHTPKYIREKFTTAHQEQRQNDRLGGDYTSNIYSVISGEHEKATPSSGVVANAPLPFFFTVKGPPTIRRIDGETGSKPYIVSNGGSPLEITEGIS